MQKIGENITIRRFARKVATGRIASYVHGARIGVLVDLTGGGDTLGKDLAMHVAASKPMAVSGDQVPADVVAKERSIAAARAAESGKPANIVEKMVDGAVAKFLAEVTLLAQPFVKGDGKETVEPARQGAGRDGQRLRALRRRRRHREEEGRFRGGSRGDGQGLGAFRDRVGPTIHGARCHDRQTSRRRRRPRRRQGCG